MTEATQKTVKDSSGVRMTFIFITCQPAFACFREMQGQGSRWAGCPILATPLSLWLGWDRRELRFAPCIRARLQSCRKTIPESLKDRVRGASRVKTRPS